MDTSSVDSLSEGEKTTKTPNKDKRRIVVMELTVLKLNEIDKGGDWRRRGKKEDPVLDCQDEPTPRKNGAKPPWFISLFIKCFIWLASAATDQE